MARFAPRADVAARRARVLQLRIEQRPYAEIAAELGISEGNARIDYQRALEAYAADQAASASRARDIEIAKLDVAEQAVWQVLRRKHVTVSNGKLIYLDGAPLEDDAPVLQAVDRLVRIAARRATLLGMDAPARIEVSDATDQAIRQLAEQLAAAGGVGDVEPGRAAETPRGAQAGEVGTAAT